MKIVLINASARKNGATAKILKEFAGNLSSKNGVELSFVNLSDIKLDFCLGCCQCYKNGVCYINDDAEMLSELISGADGVIIGTPCYTSSISGQLKTFIDRGHFVFEQLLKDKYTICIVTYENADGISTFKALSKLFVYSGAKTVDKLIVKLPFNSDPITNKKLTSNIETKSNKLYESILKKRTATIKNRIVHFFVFNFGLKPFVLKKGDLYSGVIKHWENRKVQIK